MPESRCSNIRVSLFESASGDARKQILFDIMKTPSYAELEFVVDEGSARLNVDFTATLSMELCLRIL